MSCLEEGESTWLTAVAVSSEFWRAFRSCLLCSVDSPDTQCWTRSGPGYSKKWCFRCPRSRGVSKLKSHRPPGGNRLCIYFYPSIVRNKQRDQSATPKKKWEPNIEYEVSKVRPIVATPIFKSRWRQKRLDLSKTSVITVKKFGSGSWTIWSTLALVYFTRDGQVIEDAI